MDYTKTILEIKRLLYSPITDQEIQIQRYKCGHISNYSFNLDKWRWYDKIGNDGLKSFYDRHGPWYEVRTIILCGQRIVIRSKYKPSLAQMFYHEQWLVYKKKLNISGKKAKKIN